MSGYGHTEAVNFFSLVGGNPSLYTSPVVSNPTKHSSSSTNGLLMVSGGMGLVEHHQKSSLNLSRKFGKPNFLGSLVA